MPRPCWLHHLLALVSLLAAGCFPSTIGAKCLTDENCPTGQLCDVNFFCDLAANVLRDGGSDAGAAESCISDGGQPANLQTDPRNCGGCGHRCALPVNAAPACVAARCARSACAPGFFDVDGTGTFGCESRCAGKSCTYPDGGTLTVNNEPIPETGLAGRALVNGSSLGANVQTNASHTNFGSVGEVTPPVGGNVVNTQHRHRAGFGNLR